MYKRQVWWAAKVIDKDTVEAHFDAMDKRLRESKRSLADGLDTILKAKRDHALGRTTKNPFGDSGLEIPPNAYNVQSLVAGTTSSGAEFIQPLLEAELWMDVILEPTLLSVIPQMPMSTKTHYNPRWGDAIYDTLMASRGEDVCLLYTSPSPRD